MIIKGRAIIYGDNVNTDEIIPGRYLHIDDPKELATHAMEDVDSDFSKKIREGGNIIVAGKNFGCGSSREQAVICLKYAGVKAIIATSFARIFFRNAINQGILVVESSDGMDIIDTFDELEINPQEGKITIVNKNITMKIHPLPIFLQNIITAGGLIQILKYKE